MHKPSAVLSSHSQIGSAQTRPVAVVPKEKAVYALRRHDRSLYTQKQTGVASAVQCTLSCTPLLLEPRCPLNGYCSRLLESDDTETGWVRVPFAISLYLVVRGWRGTGQAPTARLRCTAKEGSPCSSWVCKHGLSSLDRHRNLSVGACPVPLQPQTAGYNDIARLCDLPPPPPVSGSCTQSPMHQHSAAACILCGLIDVTTWV